MYHFRSIVVSSSLSMSSQLSPCCLVMLPPRWAILRRGWRRQDVLGAKAPGPVTIETVLGVPLAQRSQWVQSCALSSALGRNVPARNSGVVTPRWAVVPPPAEWFRHPAQVNG